MSHQGKESPIPKAHFPLPLSPSTHPFHLHLFVGNGSALTPHAYFSDSPSTVGSLTGLESMWHQLSLQTSQFTNTCGTKFDLAQQMVA